MNTEHLINRASALARMWATSAASGTRDKAARRLAKLVADPDGLDFAISFLDQVVRPEDPAAAARALERLRPGEAAFLGAGDKAFLGASRTLASYLPQVVVPAARARIRSLVGHLVVDADDRALTTHIASTLAAGHRINFNLLGEEVLGEREARTRVNAVIDLLKRPDVDYVSVNVSSLVSQISPWDLPGEVDRVAQRLRGIFAQAMATTPHKFVNLDMEKYRDLALTIEVFERLLSEQEFMHLSVGVTLQAYLPDSQEAMARLIEFATTRVHAGGAPLKVRLVKGTNLAMEKVEAELCGWAQAPYSTKLDVDANFLRLIDAVLRPEVAYVLRLGLASHNLFHIAYAHILARDRGVEAALDIEMLHGMAPGEAEAIHGELDNPLVLYTPVAAKEDFDLAISYLAHRLMEMAAPGNFLHDRYRGDLDEQERAFLAASTHAPPAEPRRSHARPPIGEEFTNAPIADPAMAKTRAAARAAVSAEPPELTIPSLADSADVDRVVETAQESAGEWSQQPAATRAEVLRTIAQELDNRRDELLTVMAHEAGKTIGEADCEVSEAIDFACYYAEEAQKLAERAEAEGLEFTPDSVVVVTPPWSSPVAIALGGAFAALAAGAAPIVKPAPQTLLCTQVGMEAVRTGLRAHEIREDTVQIVHADDGEVGRALVAHTDVDTVLLTGSLATARLFTSWRVGRERGPRVFAEASGKNALIVTPSADYDLAVKDAVLSAFGGAGQKCSAASLLILVGQVATSERFRRQLIDAVESLHVDWPTDLSAQVGPIIAPAEGKLHRVLTTLGEGEQWLVEPQQLDDAGRLWRPGAKVGVQPGSEFHLTEFFGPVLGIMAAESLEQALEWQNGTEFGLTGGIHSLNPGEIDQWLEEVQVGNACVNRHITGAAAGRKPLGGWKNSSVGPGAKAGGPGYLAQLGRWRQVSAPTQLGDIGPRVGQFLDATATWITPEERDWLRVAARSDAHTRDVYSAPVDRTGLRCETNVFRYRPGPRMTIRAGENTRLVDVLRLSAAALAAGVEAGVSVPPSLFAQLPEEIRTEWQNLGVPALEDPEPAPSPATDGLPTGVDMGGTAVGVVAGWQVETLEEFTTRASTWVQPGRIRCLDAAEVGPISAAVSTSVAVLGAEALQSGQREVLGFLREQTVSRTHHRFGQVGRLEVPHE